MRTFVHPYVRNKAKIPVSKVIKRLQRIQKILGNENIHLSEQVHLDPQQPTPANVDMLIFYLNEYQQILLEKRVFCLYYSIAEKSKYLLAFPSVFLDAACKLQSTLNREVMGLGEIEIQYTGKITEDYIYAKKIKGVYEKVGKKLSLPDHLDARETFCQIMPYFIILHLQIDFVCFNDLLNL